jgi:hypothetical protein
MKKFKRQVEDNDLGDFILQHGEKNGDTIFFNARLKIRVLFIFKGCFFISL